jgi:hypothetical protein
VLQRVGALDESGSSIAQWRALVSTKYEAFVQYLLNAVAVSRTQLLETSSLNDIRISH